MTISGTKRKHTSITPEEPRKDAKAAVSENDAPHLPSDVMAHVLDFLPFSDVRSAILTGKHIAVHASRQIETLNIMESDELNMRVTRRYTNVKEINIGCILVNRTFVQNSFLEKKVSSDAVVRIVPFLSCFPRLERASIYTGNYLSRRSLSRLRVSSKQDYSYLSHAQRGEHRENNTMMQSLVLSFCGGFDSGSLAQNLDVEGIVGHRNMTYTCDRVRGSTESCKICRAVFKSFPLNIIKHLRFGGGASVGHYCVPLEEQLQIMKRREDWGEYLSQPCDIVLNMLKDSTNFMYFEEYFYLNQKEAEKVELMKTTNPFVYVIPEDVKGLIEKAFQFGIRPELLPFDHVANFNVMTLPEKGCKFRMAKDAFDWMLSNGFHLDNNTILPLRKDEYHVLEENLLLEELPS